MSHFTILVITKDMAAINAALDPYDENGEVAPYPEWLVDKDVERATEFYTKAAAEGRAKGERISRRLDPEVAVPEGQLDAFERWQAACLAEYHGVEPHRVLSLDEALRHWTDAEPPADARWALASTRNPDGYWDWWTIGGRWSGYFDVHPDHQAQHEELRAAGEMGWGEGSAFEGASTNTTKVDWGRKKYLDLAGMRQRAADRAGERYDAVIHIVEQSGGWPDDAWIKTPPEKLMPTSPQYDAEIAAAFAIAKDAYWDHPTIKALSEAQFVSWGELPTIEYGVSREVFMAEARAGAIPGYAVIDKAGRWIAPGKMGWFGMSSDEREDRIGYLEVANGLVDHADPDDLLVIVDAHV